ncbi:hypothetical protein B9D04_03400 [Weissella cibaria]|uniref:HXXEE domain-containing protein n=1 Tax=Weissella cibaria TaxID=137591 RepID=A0A1X4JLG9_9LACO|nr:HXXEE domain-containing protein [Weissella cibaria]OSP89579.1 hypothetical protein B9D04_03400 [Weissella cibaria]
MSALKIIVWMLPIIFMIHDFEEIVFVEAWKRRQKHRLSVLGEKAPFNDLGSTPSFSIGVLLEFIVFSGIAGFAAISNNYYVWLGLFFGFAGHLVVHCIMAVNFKGYVPGLYTSLPFLPVSIGIIVFAISRLEMSIFEIGSSFLLGAIIMLGMVKLLHLLMDNFETWLTVWSKPR